MSVKTISSRAFNQDVGGAKRAARDGPVFITDRGKLSHVLLSAEDYRRLTGQRRNLVETLSMPGLSKIDFEPPRLTIPSRTVDF